MPTLNNRATVSRQIALCASEEQSRHDSDAPQSAQSCGLVWRSPSICAKRSGYVDSWSYRATGRSEAMRAGHAPSPLQRHSTCSLSSCTLTVTRSTNKRTISCRSCAVVSGACHIGWHILSQAQDRLAFRRRQLQGPLASEPGILFLQLLLVTERLFPLLLQRTGHTGDFPARRLRTAGPPAGRSSAPAPALVPMGLLITTFGTQGLLRCHTQLKRRRYWSTCMTCSATKRSRNARQAEAPRRTVINRGPHARVAQVIGLAPVGGHQPPPAAPTHQQAYQ